MVQLRRTISSNSTSLFRARETVPGVVPQSARWFEVEPNEYDDTGTELEKTARQPINSSRQRKRPTTQAKNVRIGFTQDITPHNTLQPIEEFLFADARRKPEIDATAVTATGYTVAAGGAVFKANMLVFVTGAANPANNGLKLISADSTATEIKVAGLVAAAGQTIRIVNVGFQFPAGDAAIALVNGRAALSTAATSLSQFGMIPGEIVYLNDDADANRFATAANRGWLRVFEVNANSLVFDKTDAAMSVDAGTGKTIRLFFGRVVKNELLAQQKQLTTCFRQMLGVPDLDAPTVVQSRAFTRSVANEMTLVIPEEDRCTMEVGYLCADEVLYDNDAVLDATGTFVTPEETDAFNSTSDMQRSRIDAYTGSTLTNLFAVTKEGEITINNNVGEMKANTVFGTYDLTPGNFEVDLSLTVYFVTLAAIRAINNNQGCTYMAAWSRLNAGLAIDVPYLVSATDGLEIELNEAVTLPMDNMAADGRGYVASMPHTILFVQFPYLPTVAASK